MGSPLADALADYRDQLTPEPGPRRRRWRWRWMLGLTVAVLLAGGVVTVTRGGDPAPAPPATPVGSPAVAPPTGSTDAGSGEPGGPAGIDALAVPPAAGWVPWSTPIIRTWLPRVPDAGPADPPAAGFTRTPAGALAAAATLYPLAYWSYPEAAWTRVADQHVVWAPGQRRQLEQGLNPVWGTGLPTPVVVTPVGYRPVSYSPDRARVRLWWEHAHPDQVKVIVGSVVEVRWVDGDWALFFDEPAMDARGLRPTDTYLVWGPQ